LADYFAPGCMDAGITPSMIFVGGAVFVIIILAMAKTIKEVQDKEKKS
jgi:uncharacterized membrane protein